MQNQFAQSNAKGAHYKQEVIIYNIKHKKKAALNKSKAITTEKQKVSSLTSLSDKIIIKLLKLSFCEQLEKT